MNTSAPARPALDCPSDISVFSECYSSPSDLRSAGPVGLRLVGTAATGLALVGVVLPLLPTTPFLLVAAWAFARSSPRLNAWLRGHPRLGPPLDAWEKRRAIPRHAKAIVVVSMPVSWILLWSAGVPTGMVIGGGAVMLAAGGWILSRPS